MKTTKEKMLEVLEETVSFYSEDPNRRAGGSGGDCFYLDEETGNKCAIGRLLNKKDLELLKKKEMLAGYAFEEVRGILSTKKIKELPTSFLRDLQNLHDDDGFWSMTSINKDGKYEVARMKRVIKHNGYRI